MTRKQARDFKAFKAHCERWIRRFGLLDWRVDYRADTRPPEYGAEIHSDIECRHATIRYNVATTVSMTTEHLALHEVLHLLLADHNGTLAIRASRQHADVLQEEHRLLERLLGVLIHGR